MSRIPLCVLLLGSLALPQPIFESQPIGNFPVLPLVDVEGVGALGNPGAGLSRVQGATGCGWPQGGGFQYAHLVASGASPGISIPPGGPIPRAGAIQYAAEIRFPIPPGALGVQFAWEFFDAEQSATFNDAFQVSVIDAAGNTIGPPLVYCDVVARLASTGSFCPDPTGLVFGALELGLHTALGGVAGGPQNTGAIALPQPLPLGAMIAVTCANAVDNAVASSAIVDDFIFLGNLPQWTFAQTGGAGTTFEIGLTNCLPSSLFFMPVTINYQGSYPNGWCMGVDIDIPLLLLELNFGPPFISFTDATGAFYFPVPPGVLAPGTNLYAALGFFTPNLSFQFAPRTVTIQ
jgi:hypothetical protein